MKKLLMIKNVLVRTSLYLFLGFSFFFFLDNPENKANIPLFWVMYILLLITSVIVSSMPDDVWDDSSKAIWFAVGIAAAGTYIYNPSPIGATIVGFTVSMAYIIQRIVEKFAKKKTMQRAA